MGEPLPGLRPPLTMLEGLVCPRGRRWMKPSASPKRLVEDPGEASGAEEVLLPSAGEGRELDGRAGERGCEPGGVPVGELDDDADWPG